MVTNASLRLQTNGRSSMVKVSGKKTLNDYLDKQFKTQNDQTAREFKYTANWLKGWACSRTQGLGTLIPWDNQFVIESLSDSTIYWAYQLAKPYLHEDINGDKGLSLAANDLDDAFFD